MELGNTPPHDIESEKAALGACMLESASIDSVVNILPKELDVFYDPINRCVYKAILQLYSENSPIDFITVTAQVRKNNETEIANAYEITSLTTKVNSSANIEKHCRIIQECYFSRLIIKSNYISIEKLYQNQAPFEILENEYKKLEYIMQFLDKKESKSLSVIVDENIAQTKLAMTLPDHVTGIHTGFKELDMITAGFQKSDLIIIAARPGMGKGLLSNELIKTPNGNAYIKNLKVGSKICNSYGGTSIVTGYYPQGERPIYEITFDDGLKVKADDQHLWEVQDREIRKKGSSEVRVISTQSLLKEGLYVNNSNRKNFSIKYPAPVYHAKKELLIEPYILGCLIGDGYLSSNGIGFCNTEYDILNKFEVAFKDKFKNKNVNSRINKCSLYDHLDKYGLINKLSYEKFIPKNYLYSSIDDRLNILKGLLDTDGTIVSGNENHIEYSTTSLELKDNILTLVRGLGGRCSFTERTGKYKKEGEYIETRLNFRIWITFPKTIIPVSSKKHLNKYLNKKQFHKRFITDIKSVGREETICIKVDSFDECFLMNDYLVTHNTSLALQMATSAAINNKKTAFFSLEMNENQLVARLQSSAAEISLENMNSGRISTAELEYVKEKSQFIKSLPLEILDRSSLSVLELKAECARLKKQNGLDIVFVDYLQLMSGDGSNRESQIGNISRGLKGLAKELNTPVIALSQLSRAVETRGGDKRPQLSDLRDSGSIEQDADMVMFLYRSEYYGITEDEEGNSTLGTAEIIVSKNRQGRLASLWLKFTAKFVKFTDMNYGFGDTSDKNQQLQKDYSGKSVEKDDEKWY